MNNNDILRRLRYALNLSNQQAVRLFTLDPSSKTSIQPTQLAGFLAKEESEDYLVCSDQQLKAFLDGLIVQNRGLKKTSPGEKRQPTEERLSKNDILKKLRIALSFQEADMISTLELGGSKVSKSELGAFFRKPGHKHYRTCGNQVLRNFIKGLTIKMRTES